MRQTTEMMKKLKTERHQWWPEALSQFWADANGAVTRVSSDGKVLTQEPRKLRFIKNAHHIKMAREPTVWDHSYERAFDAADNSFPGLVGWLRAQLPKEPTTSEGLSDRLTPVRISQADHERMAECVASLIVRSPGMRHAVRVTTEYYRERIGLPEPKADESLLGANLRSGQRMLGDTMKRRGKFAILHSPDRELIFADGFLHNISGFVNQPSSPQCLVPITPEIALFYTSLLSYRSFPRAFCLSLNAEEARLVNRLTQIYAGDYIFYRTECPVLVEEFTRDVHLQLRYHAHPWLEELSTAICDTYYGSDAFFCAKEVSCVIRILDS